MLGDVSGDGKADLAELGNGMTVGAAGADFVQNGENPQPLLDAERRHE